MGQKCLEQLFSVKTAELYVLLKKNSGHNWCEVITCKVFNLPEHLAVYEYSRSWSVWDCLTTCSVILASASVETGIWDVDGSCISKLHLQKYPGFPPRQPFAYEVLINHQWYVDRSDIKTWKNERHSTGMFAVASAGGADVHNKPESKSEMGSGAEFSKPWNRSRQTVLNKSGRLMDDDSFAFSCSEWIYL